MKASTGSRKRTHPQTKAPNLPQVIVLESDCWSRRNEDASTFEAGLATPPAKAAKTAASSAAGSSVAAVYVYDNSTIRHEYEDIQLSREEFARRLRDPARLECPALEVIGIPLILVPHKYGRSLVTHKRRSDNIMYSEQDGTNENAALLATNLTSKAKGHRLVGHAVAMRTDGVDFTAQQCKRICDLMINSLLESAGTNDFDKLPLEKTQQQLRKHLKAAADKLLV